MEDHLRTHELFDPGCHRIIDIRSNEKRIQSSREDTSVPRLTPNFPCPTSPGGLRSNRPPELSRWTLAVSLGRLKCRHGTRPGLAEAGAAAGVLAQKAHHSAKGLSWH